MKSSLRRLTIRDPRDAAGEARGGPLLGLSRSNSGSAKRPPARYVLIFKNHGPAAGATLEHPHSQLIALPIVPTNVTAEIEGCREHFQNKERCIYCDIIRQESGDRARVVTENGEFLRSFRSLRDFL